LAEGTAALIRKMKTLTSVNTGIVRDRPVVVVMALGEMGYKP